MKWIRITDLRCLLDKEMKEWRAITDLSQERSKLLAYLINFFSREKHLASLVLSWTEKHFSPTCLQGKYSTSPPHAHKVNNKYSTFPPYADQVNIALFPHNHMLTRLVKRDL